MVSDPVSKVYADALFELARRDGGEERVCEEAGFLTELHAGEADFRALLVSPAIDREEKKRILRALFDGRLDARWTDTLCILVDRNRQFLLPAICERLRARRDAERGVVDVRARTAVPLPEALARRLGESIRGRTGLEARLRNDVEPDLLGGIIFDVGDQHVDGSLARHLRRMREALRRRRFPIEDCYDEN